MKIEKKKKRNQLKLFIFTLFYFKVMTCLNISRIKNLYTNHCIYSHIWVHYLIIAHSYFGMNFLNMLFIRWHSYNSHGKQGCAQIIYIMFFCSNIITR